MRKELEEVFNATDMIQIENSCKELALRPNSHLAVFSPPCSEFCPYKDECKYELIISFKIFEEEFTYGLPKGKSFKIPPAAFLKLLSLLCESLTVMEEKSINSEIIKDAFQILASQLQVEFLLYNKKGDLILSHLFLQQRPLFLEGLEKLQISPNAEGTVKTSFGKFYYHRPLKGKEPEGVLLWRMKSAKKAENEAYKTNDHFFALIGKNPHFVEIKKLLKHIAQNDHTVLLQGESGTGKELFARYIHNLSPRKENPFIAINCAAIPENLLESELFGYEDGSFTGAKKGGKPGKFELADGGTIFLDEIGDMPMPLQAKLLRVLEDRRVERVGATSPRPVDIRVIAATNKDLKELIEKKMFREDLFFRLNVFPVNIPPLRERRDDIPLLLDFYLKNVIIEQDWGFKIFSPEAQEILKNYTWPGNIRELKNVVTYAASICKEDIITPDYLPKYLMTGAQSEVYVGGNLKGKSSFDGEKDVKHRLETLLEKYGRSTEAKKVIAGELGVSLATLYRWLNKYGISR